MTRHMTVQRYLARPSIEIRGERLAKERLRRRNAAVTAKEKVDRLSLLVDRSMEVVLFASYGNVRLVGAPGSTDGSRESVPALLIFRGTYRVTHRRIVLWATTTPRSAISPTRSR